MSLKIRIIRRESQKDSGIILISALWVILILSVLALTLSRVTSVEVSLTKFSLGRAAAYYAARAGILYAVDLIREDSADSVFQNMDTLYACGVVMPDEKTKEDIFQVPLSERRSFKIGFPQSDSSKDNGFTFGFTDEESKINLNAITVVNDRVLVNLLRLLDIGQQEAEIITASVIDWLDEDNQPTREPNGAEVDYYERLPQPYKAKNRPFEYVEELLLLKGVTPEIYERIKNYLTVFPREAPGLYINGNTADRYVFQAVLEYLSENSSGMQIDNAQKLFEKIEIFRNGQDGQAGTRDDQALAMQGDIKDLFEFSTEEEHLYLRFIHGNHRPVSSYLRVRSVGVDDQSGARSTIEAVINRDGLIVAQWKRDLL